MYEVWAQSTGVFAENKQNIEYDLHTHVPTAHSLNQ